MFNLGAPAVLSSRVFAIRTAPAHIRIQRRSLRHQGRKAGFRLPTNTAVGKQPYEIALADRRLMTLADPVGDLALGGGRKDPELHDRDDDTERIGRGASQPHARGAATRRMAIVARRTAGGLPQLKALLAPCPSNEMICWPVSIRVGNVKNNDPSLIEPIARRRAISLTN